jgi:hypothetical protein
MTTNTWDQLEAEFKKLQKECANAAQEGRLIATWTAELVPGSWRLSSTDGSDCSSTAIAFKANAELGASLLGFQGTKHQKLGFWLENVTRWLEEMWSELCLSRSPINCVPLGRPVPGPCRFISTSEGLCDSFTHEQVYSKTIGDVCQWSAEYCVRRKHAAIRETSQTTAAPIAQTTPSASTLSSRMASSASVGPFLLQLGQQAELRLIFEPGARTQRTIQERDRKFDIAIRLFEKQPGFIAAKVRMDETINSIRQSQADSDLASRERLCSALLDARAAMFVSLVTTLDLQNSFIDIVDGIKATAWGEYNGIGAPPELASPEGVEQVRMFQLISAWANSWVQTGYRQLSAAEEESAPKPPAESGGPSSIRGAFVTPILSSKGWSIQDWAINSGVDFHTANDFLKGTTKAYNSTRKKLADSLGVDVSTLPR